MKITHSNAWNGRIKVPPPPRLTNKVAPGSRIRVRSERARVMALTESERWRSETLGGVSARGFLRVPRRGAGGYFGCVLGRGRGRGRREAAVFQKNIVARWAKGSRNNLLLVFVFQRNTLEFREFTWVVCAWVSSRNSRFFSRIEK
jgi:hypothetical protein